MDALVWSSAVLGYSHASCRRLGKQMTDQVLRKLKQVRDAGRRFLAGGADPQNRFENDIVLDLADLLDDHPPSDGRSQQHVPRTGRMIGE